MIRTDGIYCSVLIEGPHVRDQTRQRRHVPRAEPEYFEDHLADLKDDKIFIDPNRRDLQYILGSNDEKLRYTSVQRRRETKAKEHDRIRTRIEVDAGLRGPVTRGQPQPHAFPALPNKATVDLGHFEGYLIYFLRTLEEKEEVYGNPIFRKLRFAK
jgi:hypothetical protein